MTPTHIIDKMNPGNPSKVIGEDEETVDDGGKEKPTGITLQNCIFALLQPQHIPSLATRRGPLQMRQSI